MDQPKGYMQTYGHIVATIVVSELTRYAMQKIIHECERRNTVANAANHGEYL